MRRKRVTYSLVALVACSGGDDVASPTSDTAASTTGVTSDSTATTTTTVPTGTTETTSTSTSETTTSQGAAPFFISFSTNVGQITEGESVTFTAIMSDPDGFDDIAGGTLFAEGGMFSYGPFLSAGQEGTYSISVSWTQIDQVAAIEFENFTMERIFRAEFFDKDGHMVFEDTSITLHCAGGGACGGACKDLQSDDVNCGACGAVCAGGCGDGVCLPVFGECIAAKDGFSTCGEYCQGVAEMCVSSGCGGDTYKGYNATPDCVDDVIPSHFSASCGEPLTWGPGEIVVRCCCSDTN